MEAGMSGGPTQVPRKFSLQLKDNKELMKILENNEIPKDEPILLSCGSGVSVCHMALVLEECGYPSPFI
jgi:3-mercaptopyruvate sulfurtransferase SseA